MDVIQIDELSIRLKIDQNLYTSEVIHKCFYWYTKDFTVDIELEENNFLITLVSRNKTIDFNALIHKIKSDLIDFKTRDIISKETRNIRDLLIAKAFSNYEEFDESPPGNVNDPIGFDPSKI